MDPSSWSPGLSQRGSGGPRSTGGSRQGLRGRSLASLHAVSENGVQGAASRGAPGGNAATEGASAAGLASVLPERRASALQLLSSAAKVYLEGSSHGRRSQRGGKAAAALLAAASSHGAGAMRQVADDSQRGLAQRRQAAAALRGVPHGGDPSVQPHQPPLGALPDGSTSSSSSASSHGLAAAAGTAPGASRLGSLDPERSEGRQRGTMVAALAAGVPHEHINAMLAMRTAGSGSLPSSLGSPPCLAAVVASENGTAAGTPAHCGDAPRPGSIADALAAAAPDTPAGAATAAPTAAAASLQSVGGSRSGAGLDGLRPHRVVQRRSLENPLVGPAAAAAAGACCWG